MSDPESTIKALKKNLKSILKKNKAVKVKVNPGQFYFGRSFWNNRESYDRILIVVDKEVYAFDVDCGYRVHSSVERIPFIGEEFELGGLTYVIDREFVINE